MAQCFLGIDPGTKCGWALLGDTGEHIASGTWDLTPGRGAGPGMRPVRLRFRLLELFNDYGFKAVAYEEVRRHAGTQAAHVYGELRGVITSLCEERGIAYCGAPVATVKRLATKKGNADKDAMVAAARAFWPDVRIEDDNHADALWIAEALRQGEL